MTSLPTSILFFTLLAVCILAASSEETYTVCDVSIQQEDDLQMLIFNSQHLSQSQVACLLDRGLHVSDQPPQVMMTSATTQEKAPSNKLSPPGSDNKVDADSFDDRVLSSDSEMLLFNESIQFSVNDLQTQEIYYPIPHKPTSVHIIIEVDQYQSFTVCYYPQMSNFNKLSNCQDLPPMFHGEYAFDLDAATLKGWAGSDLIVSIKNPHADSTGSYCGSYSYYMNYYIIDCNYYVYYPINYTLTGVAHLTAHGSVLSTETIIIIATVPAFFVLLCIAVAVSVSLRNRRKRACTYSSPPQAKISPTLQAPALILSPQFVKQPAPAPLTKNELNVYFPANTFASHSSQFPQLSCSLCSVEFQPEASSRQLHCRHIFHRGCVDDWFRKQNDCPTCSSPMTRDAIQRLLLSCAAGTASPQNPVVQSRPAPSMTNPVVMTYPQFHHGGNQVVVDMSPHQLNFCQVQQAQGVAPIRSD